MSNKAEAVGRGALGGHVATCHTPSIHPPTAKGRVQHAVNQKPQNESEPLTKTTSIFQSLCLKINYLFFF